MTTLVKMLKTLKGELFGVEISNRLVGGSTSLSRWFQDERKPLLTKTIRL